MISVIIKNLFKQSFDKKSKYIFFFALPIVTFVVIFALFGNYSNSYKINLAIIDNSKDEISKLICNSLVENKSFTISFINEDNIESELTRVDGILIIPSNFTGKQKIAIKVIKNPLLVKGVESHINRVINDFNNNASQLTIKEREVETNDGLKNVSTRALGFLLVFMFAQGLNVTGLLIKNKENKTYYRLKTSPIKMSVYLAGNLIAAFLIVMIQVFVGILIISSYFSFNVAPVLLISASFAIVVVSVGLLITSIARTRELSNNISTLIMTPTAMLGGCFWSVDLMPSFMQKISLFTPHYWAMSGFSKVNSGNYAIGQCLLVLFAFSLLAGLFAVYNFKTNRN